MILSLLQPWASLWVAGAKLIETRSWGTSYRGRIAVHASKAFKQDEMRLCQEEPFATALTKLGVAKFRDIPTGKVLGIVKLIDCIEMGTVEFPLNKTTNKRLTPDEVAFGGYSPGRFAWITDPIARQRLPEPIPARGQLGLRHCPGDICARLGL